MTNTERMGVWISPTGQISGPDWSNLFRYVGNNPTNLTDPSGLEPPPGRPQLNRPGIPQYFNFDRIPSLKWDDGKIVFPAKVAMERLGFDRYQSIWPDALPTNEYNLLNQGCVGLNSIRLGIGAQTPHSKIPGVRCFSNLIDALQSQLTHTNKDRFSVLFAVQATKDKSEFRSFLKPGSDSEYEPILIVRGNLGDYNFATAIQTTNADVAFWEYMPSGNTANPELKVTHSLTLPKKAMTFYCTAEISKHKCMPPVLDPSVSIPIRGALWR